MAGGMMSSFLMELLIYPVLYLIWRQRQMVSAAPYRVIAYRRGPILLTKIRRVLDGSDRFSNERIL